LKSTAPEEAPVNDIHTPLNDIRTTTTLVCAILAIVIAIPMMFPKRRYRVHVAFVAFAFDLAAWYSCQAWSWLSDAPNTPPQEIPLRIGVTCAVVLPHLALWLFDAIAPRDTLHGSSLRRYAPFAPTGLASVCGLVYNLQDPVVRVTLFSYTVAFLAWVLLSVRARGKRSASGLIRGRVEVLVIIGGLAFLGTLVDFASVAFQPNNNHLPPVGAVFSIIVLYALREALRSEWRIDMWDLLDQLTAATVLGALMAVLFRVLSAMLSNHFDSTFLAAVLGITVCVVFDLVRAMVQRVTKSGRRLGLRIWGMPPPLEASMLQRRLLHVLTVEDMKAIVMNTLDASRRVTSAALYLRDPDGTGFDRIVSLGPSAASGSGGDRRALTSRRRCWPA
jgi:two-component system, NtrC family, sensor histidine kinase HydH